MQKRDKALLRNSFSSVNRYEPARVQAVRSKHGDEAANKMKVAIALDKAREQGVKV